MWLLLRYRNFERYVHVHHVRVRETTRSIAGNTGPKRRRLTETSRDNATEGDSQMTPPQRGRVTELSLPENEPDSDIDEYCRWDSCMEYFTSRIAFREVTRACLMTTLHTCVNSAREQRTHRHQ